MHEQKHNLFFAKEKSRIMMPLIIIGNNVFNPRVKEVSTNGVKQS